MEQQRTSFATSLQAQDGDNSNNVAASHDDRRGFLARAASKAALAAALTVVPFPQPALAVGGMNKVNDKLRGFGLPTYPSVPDGFTPLCEIWGKGKNRFPILVTFAHPLTWIVTVPSNDANGEDGTVQAGEYAKGDTATFFVNEEPGHVADIQTAPKEVIERTLIKAISQKGDNMYQVRLSMRVTIRMLQLSH